MEMGKEFWDPFFQALTAIAICYLTYRLRGNDKATGEAVKAAKDVQQTTNEVKKNIEDRHEEIATAIAEVKKAVQEIPAGTPAKTT